MNPAQLFDWINSQPPTKEWIFGILDYCSTSEFWNVADVGKAGDGCSFWAVFLYFPTGQAFRLDFTLVDAVPRPEPGALLH